MNKSVNIQVKEPKKINDKIEKYFKGFENSDCIIVIGNEKTIMGAIKGVKENYSFLQIKVMNFKFKIDVFMKDDDFKMFKKEDSLYEGLLKEFKKGEGVWITI